MQAARQSHRRKFVSRCSTRRPHQQARPSRSPQRAEVGHASARIGMAQFCCGQLDRSIESSLPTLSYTAGRAPSLSYGSVAAIVRLVAIACRSAWTMSPPQPLTIRLVNHRGESVRTQIIRAPDGFRAVDRCFFRSMRRWFPMDCSPWKSRGDSSSRFCFSTGQRYQKKDRLSDGRTAVDDARPTSPVHD